MGFVAIIILGAVLLTLPISSRDGTVTPFLTCLFTTTSATCVTGQVMVDTFLHWSIFGQIVILTLIQIGGLGFMTITAMFVVLVRKSIGLNEKINLMSALSLNNMADIRKLLRNIFLGTLIIEGSAAIIFSIRFSFDFGIKRGIYIGVFHAISSFCNAGFDLFGINGTGFISLTGYANDYLICILTMLLIVIGGLGFLVWTDILSYRKKKRLSMYPKAVLTMTAILIFGGALIFAFNEWNNPATIGNMSVGGKILNSFFQSVTLRTAGFNTISQSGLTKSSFMVSCLLMFIGGSSGSTAGGIKTITFLVMLLTVINVARGNREVKLFKRKISNDDILRAITITLLVAFLLFCGILAISIIEPFSLREITYECFSVFGTVGVSMGITPFISPITQIILICMMFLGRVGILTFTYAISLKMLNKNNYISYPETKILIG